MLILILTQWAVGQAPDPDTPFTPYWEVDAGVYWEDESRFEAQIQHETLGYKVIPEGSDLDYDLDISGSICPFTLNALSELDVFQAECVDVELTPERILVPVGCRFTMKLKGKMKARIEHKTCPVLIKLHEEEWLPGA